MPFIVHDQFSSASQYGQGLTLPSSIAPQAPHWQVSLSSVLLLFSLDDFTWYFTWFWWRRFAWRFSKSLLLKYLSHSGHLYCIFYFTSNIFANFASLAISFCQNLRHACLCTRVTGPGWIFTITLDWLLFDLCTFRPRRPCHVSYFFTMSLRPAYLIR